MSLKMQVSLHVDQRLTMNMQLRQAIALLQYNTIELTQHVKQALEINPLLEIDEMDYSAEQPYQDQEISPKQYSAVTVKSTSSLNYNDNNDNYLENYPIPISLRSHLLEQTLLSQFTATEQIIAESLIDGINDEGFLTVSMPDIAESLSTLQVSETEVESVLKKIQTYDPCGVGARDLRECFLVQLNERQEKNAIWTWCHAMVNTHWDLLFSNKPKNLIKKLRITPEQFSQAMKLIRQLNPKPGLLYADDRYLTADPELFVEKIKDKWHVFLKNSLLTQIKINDQYRHIIKSNRKDCAFESMRNELEQARSLLKGLEKRNQTLLAVGSYIVEAQKDFFDKGALYMKAMNITEVAEALNVHESTVSRITSGKYIATPHGVFELKYFFPSYVQTDGGSSCSATTVKALIKKLIDQESDGKILSDLDISVLLKTQGVCASRRTITKYRESMNILSSYLRQKKFELA